MPIPPAAFKNAVYFRPLMQFVVLWLCTLLCALVQQLSQCCFSKQHFKFSEQFCLQRCRQQQQHRLSNREGGGEFLCCGRARAGRATSR